MGVSDSPTNMADRVRCLSPVNLMSRTAVLIAVVHHETESTDSKIQEKRYIFVLSQKNFYELHFDHIGANS